MLRDGWANVTYSCYIRPLYQQIYSIIGTFMCGFYLREAKESCRLQRLRHISVKNMNQCNKSSFLK